VFLLALVLRVAVVVQSADSPYHQHLVLDSATYHGIAVDGDPAEPYWQPPLYPWLLRAVYAVVGQPSPLAVRLLQAVMGAVTAVLVMLLVRRWRTGWPPILAGVATALTGSLIYFDAELLPASPAALLVAGWLLMLASPGRAGSRWARLRPVAVGLLLGVGGLLLPTLAIPAALALIWMARREGLKRAVIVAMAAAVPILPVTVRNYAYEPDLVPVSWNGGVNFWIGNNPDFPASVGIRPGIRWSQLVSRPRCEGGAETRAEESAWFYGESLSYVASQPLSWAGDLARKALATVSAQEIGRNRNPYAARDESAVLRVLLLPAGVPFVPLLGAFTAGLVAAALRRRVPWLLLLVVLGFLAVNVLFFPTARYRVPALPLMIAIAAIGLPDWLRASSDPKRLWARALVPVAVVLSLVPSGMPRVPAAETYYEIGVDMSHDRQPQRAIPMFEQGLELSPEHADLHRALGLALLRVGREPEGRRHLERAIELEPRAATAWQALAGLARSDGDLERARELYENAVEADPCNPRIRADLATLLIDMGYYNGAAEVIEEARRIAPRSNAAIERAARRLEKLNQMRRSQPEPSRE
jgi:tetratricopeptide (TPR) repeat protein